MLTTLSENIRDSTQRLKPSKVNDDGGKENEAASDTGPSGGGRAEEGAKDAELSEEILREAASRDAAARKFRLVEQERERQREKQREELERRAAEEMARREEESRAEMERLERESQARMEAIEESFKQAELELAMEAEKEREEAERMEREAEEQMAQLREQREREERRDAERRDRRAKMEEAGREERRRAALGDLRASVAARAIQRHYLDFRVKKVAAVKIQASVRRRRAEKMAEEAKALREAAVLVQSAARGLLARRLLRSHKMARTVQTHFRGRSAARKLRVCLRSVIKIQAHVRMWPRRAEFDQAKRGALAIQSHFRMCRERRRLVGMVRAANVIAAAWRKHSAEKTSAEDLSRKVEDCATKGSLHEMRSLAALLGKAGRRGGELLRRLQRGLDQRCREAASSLVKAGRQGLDVLSSGESPRLPLADAGVRASAEGLGMAQALRDLDAIEALTSSLADRKKARESCTIVLGNASPKSEPAPMKDLAYAWSMEEERSALLATLFWPRAYAVMSLRQQKYLLNYDPARERRKVHPLALNAGHYPQLAEPAKRNELTEEMLALNSPGIRVGEVTDLDLSLEGLTSVKEIRKCKGLRKLCLNSNSIRSLEGLEGCPMLEELSMKGNVLRGAEELKAASRMRALHLDGNAINSVGFASTMKSLREFTADDNRIEVFACEAALMGSLEVLSVAGNRIKDLGSIPDLAGLRELNLSRNHIQAFDGLERCTRLGKVNLSNNYICAVPSANKMNALASLTELRLSKNRLTAFPFACLSLPSLRALHLDENSIAEIEPVLGCPLLETLELAFNDIKGLDSVANLSGCQRLKFLNLSENPVAGTSHFAAAARRFLPSLAELNNEPVEAGGEAVGAARLGTSLLKWSCIRKLNPERLMQNSPDQLLTARAQAETYLSNHTLAARYAPLMACFADSRSKSKETWRSGIALQWADSTRDALRLTESECEDPECHQRVFSSNPDFYAKRTDFRSREACKIQSCWRRFFAARRSYRESSEGRQKAALAIQGGWRRLKLRRRPEYSAAKDELLRLRRERTRKESERRARAAVSIQASWRGHKVRSYLERARMSAKYVDEDDGFDLSDLDDDMDFLRDFESQADQFLSTVVLPPPAQAARTPKPPAYHSVQEPALHLSPPARMAEEPAAAAASPALAVTRTPNRPSPVAERSKTNLSSQAASPLSAAPSQATLRASESSLSVHEEKRQAKMERIATEWGFKDQATAALFMKKRNKMVRQQQKRKAQMKMRDPSVRYRKFKEATGRHEPLQFSPEARHKTGKALSLARGSVLGPSSREGRRQRGSPAREFSGASTHAGPRQRQSRLLRDSDENSVSTISMGSDEVHGGGSSVDPHAIAMDYLRGGGGGGGGGGRNGGRTVPVKVNNWSM